MLLLLLNIKKKKEENLMKIFKLNYLELIDTPVQLVNLPAYPLTLNCLVCLEYVKSCYAF